MSTVSSRPAASTAATCTGWASASSAARNLVPTRAPAAPAARTAATPRPVAMPPAASTGTSTASSTASSSAISPVSCGVRPPASAPRTTSRSAPASCAARASLTDVTWIDSSAPPARARSHSAAVGIAEIQLDHRGEVGRDVDGGLGRQRLDEVHGVAARVVVELGEPALELVGGHRHGRERAVAAGGRDRRRELRPGGGEADRRLLDRDRAAGHAGECGREVGHGAIVPPESVRSRRGTPVDFSRVHRNGRRTARPDGCRIAARARGRAGGDRGAAGRRAPRPRGRRADRGTGRDRQVAARRGGPRGARPDFDVLHARGGELERDFPFGVVRQLLETRVALAPAGERAALLDGAAARAAEPLGLAPAQQDDGEASFAALHGLYWLLVNLAAPARRCSSSTTRTGRTARRCASVVPRRAAGDELPVLVLAAQRSGEARSASTSLDELRDVARVAASPRRCRPARCRTPRAQPRRRRPGVRRTPATRRRAATRSCCASSCAQLRAERRRARRRRGRRVGRARPRRSAARGRAARGGLAAGAVDLARAVATLGTERGAATRGRARRPERARRPRWQPTRWPPSRCCGAGARWTSCTRSSARPCATTCPWAERAALHRRAAELLRRRRIARGRVAVQLLAAEPAGDRWVVEILREAAARSIDGARPRRRARTCGARCASRRRGRSVRRCWRRSGGPSCSPARRTRAACGCARRSPS